MENLKEALSKKIFYSLPEGLYLVSNCYLDRQNSIYESYICSSNMNDRAIQWAAIKKARASYRKVLLFKSKAEYQEYFKNVLTHIISAKVNQRETQSQ